MVEKTHREKIKRIREQNNILFKKSPHSPLTDEQKQDFKGIDYFPIDEKYEFNLEMKKFEHHSEIVIPTTKNNERRYVRFGYIEFEIDGQVNTLTVFKPIEADYLFLPFKDTTTGKESYKIGRYVEIEKISKEKWLVDFNTAYNPFCAYNDNWDCSLTPDENLLKIPINAGMKIYPDYRG
jgi:uncharacterized protein (DUF1684 family)